jgi:hypothetical protein
MTGRGKLPRLEKTAPDFVAAVGEAPPWIDPRKLSQAFPCRARIRVMRLECASSPEREP